MKEAIKKILECGIQAPSGENSQPWKFVVKSDEEVELWNVPERDQSLYNFGQFGSYVAHGALLENIESASPHFGYVVDINLFPDPTNKEFVARLTFAKAETRTDELYEAIFKRATNRKAYTTEPLTNAEREGLSVTAQEVGFGALRLVDSENAKQSVARAVSANDELVLANPHIHHFFFNHVRWNEKESEANPSGFYVPTLELAPPQLMGFKLFRHWRVAKLLNALLGVSKLVAKENAKVFMQSSAMGAVLIPSTTPEDFVKGGKLIQKLWLRATKMGLSFQPLVGGSFLMFNVFAGHTKSFTKTQIARLTVAHEKLVRTFDIGDQTIAMIFRIGKGGEPSARSPRFPIEYFMENPLFALSTKNHDAVPSDRKTIIEHILNDLRTLHGNPAFHNQYAVEENIVFFEAIKSIPSYIWWLITRAPKIDGTRLLELTDLPFPRWDREMHKKLVEMESKKSPGLIAPLVEGVLHIIQSENERFIGMNFGCGGMEVERQIVSHLLQKNIKKQVVLIGVDNSIITREIARKNLQEVEPHIAIHEVETLDSTLLEDILSRETGRHIIVLCKNDIFQLEKHFKPNTFNIIYHSLFKHHIVENDDKKKIDDIISVLAKKSLEYDGYWSVPVILPQTIVGWNHPIFLNAEIFSNLRFKSKSEIKKLYASDNVSFFAHIGTYLRKL